MTSCLGIIPARLPSSRLPGKVLRDINGLTLIERVWRQASRATALSKIVVATDSEKVFEVAKGFGAWAMMTSEKHATGSDRVAEAARILAEAGEKFSLVANIQGDMPFVAPSVIDSTINTLADASADFGMSTVARPITDREEFLRDSAVKVVCGTEGRALYFSRAPIPYPRDGFDGFEVTEEVPYGYKHIGLYVFRPETLERLAQLPSTLCEEREKLEQLRALGAGVSIKVNIVPSAELEPAIEVDTMADLDRAIAHAKTLSATTPIQG